MPIFANSELSSHTITVADIDTKSLDSVQHALQSVVSILENIKHTIHTISPKKNKFPGRIFEKEFKYLQMNPYQRAKALFTI